MYIVSDDNPLDNCNIIAPPPSKVQYADSLGFPPDTFVSNITYQCYRIASSDGKPTPATPSVVLITVNHTTLPRVITNNHTVQALNVVVGMSNQSIVGLDVLMAKSTSIPVVAGANLIVAIIPNVREVFVHPGVAAFGLYEVRNSPS